MKSIAVLGGGITGVTTAYALTRAGYNVHVFEKNRYAAMETSFANGGQLSASNAEVWNHTGTILKGMKWLLRKDAPLLVNPKPSLHKLGWFAEFIAQIPNYAPNTVETTRLAIAARDYLHSWADDENIDFSCEKRGILHIYRKKSEYDHATGVNALLKQGGLERRAVTQEEMRAIEPTLTGEFYGGYFTESDATGDIHTFATGLAKALEKRGAKLRYEHAVSSLTTRDGGVDIHFTAKGEVGHEHFDGVVVCAGVKSKEFARQLGDRVNIYPVKGYSITVDLPDEESQNAAPWVSLLDDETKLVSSRLGNKRFRVAGTAEFNGYNKDIRDDRVKPIIDWVNQLFPNVNTEHVIPWAGLRPMMPNMLPKVGAGKAPGVFYNTGHGHLGWTLCAATAAMVTTEIDQIMNTSGTKATGHDLSKAA